jgi:putative membrane protein
VALGAAQALLLFVTTLVLGVKPSSPLGTLVLLLVAASAFATVHQAFVALVGRRRGWIASIAMACLQVVALGGLVPIDAAPWVVRALNAVLPMTSTADGLVVTVVDGPGSVVASVAVLALWAGAAFGGSVLAARKAQQVDWAQLRAEIELPSQRRVHEPVG